LVLCYVKNIQKRIFKYLFYWRYNIRDEYERVQTYAQALREMNMGDMAAIYLEG